MSITYNALWAILEKQSISKKELKDRSGLSHTTMALMTQNKPVSLMTLVSICKVLQCDIGDIVHLSTEKQTLDQAITCYVKELDDPQILMHAVSDYLQMKGMSKNAFSRMTGISVNTLERILDGQPTKLSTYKKVMPYIEQEVMRTVDKIV